MTLAINALPAVSVRLISTWDGPWIADVDIDLGVPHVVPSGRVTLTIGTTLLVGTVDPRGTSRFAEKARVRVVAGAGAWDQPVDAQQYHNDAGVLSTLALSTTAAAIGETVIDGAPVRLGVDFVRSAGPASRVLGGRPWFVDFTGVTFVDTPRPTRSVPDGTIVSEWRPAQRLAVLATDDVLVPGMTLTDPRFDAATIRDVEQVFDAQGSRAEAYCGASSVSRAAAALSAMIVERSGIVWARRYPYRVVLEGPDKRLTLQAITKADGVPDALAIAAWPGMAGLSARLVPGTQVLVEFVAGDPSRPIVTAFEPGAAPLVLDVDAELVRVGGDAALTPVLLAPPVLAMLSALVAFADAAGAIAALVPVPPTNAQLAALSGALAAVNGAVAALAKAPSTLLLAAR